MRRRNEKKRSIPKDTCFYLPPELWTENILPRLPVKALLIFRSVCKSWYSAIDDPAFVTMHLKLSNNNSNKNKLLAIECAGLDCLQCVAVCHRDTLRRSAYVLNTWYKFFFLTSCNGLFLVDGYRNLKIWNLSIRKSLLLPPCPLVAHNRILKYLFGFKSSSNDYVVYAFLYEGCWPKNYFSFAVYTLSDNLWRIKNYKITRPSWLDPRIVQTMFDEKSVYFDGALHWIGKYLDGKLPWKTGLLSFNFDTEEFSYVGLPDSHQGILTKTFRFLFVLDGSLATLSISNQSSSIWVLKNYSWDLRLLKFSNAVGFKYISKHPHVISNYIYVKDGGITLVYGKVAYQIMRDEIKHLSKSLSCFVRLDAYVESLVLHKGCPGQNLTSL